MFVRVSDYMLTAEKAVNVNSLTPVSLLFLSSSLKRSIISVYVIFTVQPNSMVRRLISSSCVPISYSETQVLNLKNHWLLSETFFPTE